MPPPHNPSVVGSIPTGPTASIRRTRFNYGQRNFGRLSNQVKVFTVQLNNWPTTASSFLGFVQVAVTQKNVSISICGPFPNRWYRSIEEAEWNSWKFELDEFALVRIWNE